MKTEQVKQVIDKALGQQRREGAYDHRATQMTNTCGYVYLAAHGTPTEKVPVDTADRASAIFTRYRDHYALGASDLHERCGNIYASDGTLVAKISYNGRVWTPDDRLLQEPAVDSA